MKQELNGATKVYNIIMDAYEIMTGHGFHSEDLILTVAEKDYILIKSSPIEQYEFVHRNMKVVKSDKTILIYKSPISVVRQEDGIEYCAFRRLIIPLDFGITQEENKEKP